MGSRLTSTVAAPCLALALALIWAPPAHAEPSESLKAAARNLMAEGRELREKNDLNGALSRFQAADALMDVPTTGYEVARTQVALELLVEARATLKRVLALPESENDPEPFKAARSKARALDAELAQRLEPAREVAPGAAPAAPAPKPEPKPEPTPAPPREPHATAVREAPQAAVPTLAYVGGGVAVVGLVVGGVSGALALSKKRAAEQGCVLQRCPPATWDDLDAARSFATASTVGFVVAGVGLGIGAGALLFGREPRSESARIAGSLTLRVEPGGLSASGRILR